MNPNHVQKSLRRGVRGLRAEWGGSAGPNRIRRSLSAAVAFSTMLALISVSNAAIVQPVDADQNEALEAAYCLRVVAGYTARPGWTDATPQQLDAIRDRWGQLLAANVTPSTDRKRLMTAGALGSTDFDQCEADLRLLIQPCTPGETKQQCIQENMIFVRAHDPASCQSLRANNCLNPR